MVLSRNRFVATNGEFLDHRMLFFIFVVEELQRVSAMCHASTIEQSVDARADFIEASEYVLRYLVDITLVALV